jgi:DMSO/TMAO reductase YedYZ molybdopterin-dependent catalytic subunit
MRLPGVDPDRPPPGPFRHTFWRSPLRGPWLTAVLGLALLVSIPVIAVTGFLSNDAYNPSLGGNSVGRHLGLLDFYLFRWPVHPPWLYALTQGTHVTLGLAVFPILLAKLWSVIPRLFEWPPVRSPAHAIERLSLAFLVGGALFEFATGMLDIQYAYLFKFYFTDAHYYGAWVFSAAFVFHAAIKLGTMRSSLATRRELRPLMADLAHTRSEGAAGGTGAAGAGGATVASSDLIAPAPAAASMSRRALLGTVGVGSAFLFVQGLGDSLGGPLRKLALLGPRDRFGSGPNGFSVNRTAAAAEITAQEVGPDWRLRLSSPGHSVSLSRAELLSMPQHTYEMPIACVEGWSTTQHWTGVRVRDLAALVDVSGEALATATSLEKDGVFSAATLAPNEVSADSMLLALHVNGAALSLDHGYPARIIGPALPGVHCTKWVGEIAFKELSSA